MSDEGRLGSLVKLSSARVAKLCKDTIAHIEAERIKREREWQEQEAARRTALKTRTKWWWPWSPVKVWTPDDVRTMDENVACGWGLNWTPTMNARRYSEDELRVAKVLLAAAKIGDDMYVSVEDLQAIL